jgi:hypothetical protein
MTFLLGTATCRLAAPSMRQGQRAGESIGRNLYLSEEPAFSPLQTGSRQTFRSNLHLGVILHSDSQQRKKNLAEQEEQNNYRDRNEGRQACRMRTLPQASIDRLMKS